MTMTKDEINKYNQKTDIWHGGQHILGPHGDPCYWICQYFDKMHSVKNSGIVSDREYITWCKYRDEPEDGSGCTAECPMYGRCETCAGFSAVRCSDCDVIQYD